MGDLRQPDGKPALFVHGGPGWGSTPARRQDFDPDRYRIVLFDQRGCGRSRPHASNPAAGMSLNTTGHLLSDMERLREHLGIERWLLSGGSWGSTLILAYAQRYPHRVTEIVLTGVTTTRHCETDWLYRGIGQFLPQQWEQFRDGAGPAASAENLPAAYAQLMEDPDPAVRTRAARAWCTWEDAVLSTGPGGTSHAFRRRAPADRLAIVRICAHFFSHHAWLDDGILLRQAGQLAAIPAVLIHGRLDLSSPLSTAWQLARAWPHAELAIIDDSGHQASDAMNSRIRSALDSFARR